MKPQVVLSLTVLGALLLGGPGRCIGSELPRVEKVPFGTTRGGRTVDLYTLENTNGLRARVMTYGAILYSLEVPDREGKLDNVTANRETVADYEAKSPCFGAVVGRYANRIGRGTLVLEGKTYQLTLNAGVNHIHGGQRGFDKQVWQAEAQRDAHSAALLLTYVSRDGEEGYPGTLTCTIRYELNNHNEWRMEYTAKSDKTTVVNLSNHAYWNLGGAYSGTVLDHVLTVNADEFLEADPALIPTGRLLPVEGTPVDFRTPRRIGERISQITEKQFGGGYDHCLVIKKRAVGELASCALLKDPKTGRTMEVQTTEPGVQIYSANFGDGVFEGPNGYRYPRHLGLCLETQHFPDSPNHAAFPSTVLRPGETFHSVTVHKFGVTN